MADLKKIKNNNALIIVLVVLGVLVLVNILVSFQNNGIGDVTGRVVEEPTGINKENYGVLVNEVSRLKNENEKLIVEKSGLSKKIEELEAKIKAIEAEKEIKEEACPLTCGIEEICSPVNKKDGSVEWQCVDNPERFV